MALSRRAQGSRCRRLEHIVERAVDSALESYDRGDMVDFWGAVEPLVMLTEIKDTLCEAGPPPRRRQ